MANAMYSTVYVDRLKQAVAAAEAALAAVTAERDYLRMTAAAVPVYRVVTPAHS